MTIFEVLRNNSLFGSFSDAEINQALVVRALNGADTYAPETHLKTVELATADLMVQLTAIKAFKEGDLSITYNSEQLEAMAQRTYDKYSDKEDMIFVKGKIVNVGVSFER